MSELKLKCLIKWLGEASFERILCYHPDGESFYCIDIQGKNAWPFRRARSELEAALVEGRAMVVLADPYVSSMPVKLSEKHAKMRDQAYAAIRDLVEDPQMLVYERKQAASAIQRKQNKEAFHFTTYFKYLRRYWRRVFQ